MSSSVESTSSSAQHPHHGVPILGPDNRCCFCLTLRTGSIIVGIVNALVNALGFGWYTTSPSVQSSWSHPTPITDLDISVFAVFALQIIVDLLLIYGAIKRIHSQTVPWLCANSVVMGIMLVLVALLLFFGYVQMALAYDEYVSVLSLIGCLAAGHLFSCLVVFQFRKNLMEERALLNVIQQSEEAAEMPQNYVRPPSPPPTYEEVAKTVALPPPPALSQGSNPRDPPNLGSGDGSGQQPRSDDFDQPGKNTGGVYSALKGFDHDYDSESPPEYSAAVAALKVMQEEEAKEQSGGGEVKDGQGQDPTLGDHVSAPTLTLKLQEASNDISGEPQLDRGKILATAIPAREIDMAKKDEGKTDHNASLYLDAHEPEPEANGTD